MFSDAKSTDLQVATLDYIGLVGEGELNIDWDSLLKSAEANIARAAVRSRVLLYLRFSAVSAFEFVGSRQDIDLGERVARNLLLSAKTVESQVLRSCLGNKTTYLVRGLAEELKSREALTETDALSLCESTDARTRLLGVMALREMNDIALSDARSHVVKPKKNGGQGIFQSGAARDFEGEEAFEIYEIEELGKLGFEVLKTRRAEESFFTHSSTLATYSKHFKKSHLELEENLKNGFVSFLTSRKKEIEGTKLEPSQSLFDFVRLELVQTALEIYCSRSDRAGLSVVRAVLDQNKIKYAPEIIQFIGSFGSWQDVERVSKLCQQQKYFGLGALGILSSNFSAEYAAAASTVLKISAARVVDLWAIEMPEGLRLAVLRQMPEAKFRMFDDAKIVEMIQSEADRVREVVSLKVVVCLSKDRISRILSRYTEKGRAYYYNAVFWLDLGIAASRGLSKDAARERLVELE